MSDFDFLVSEVIEAVSSSNSQVQLQNSVLSAYNTCSPDMLGHKLKMIAWDQK